jgi:hypothetical protein
MGKPRKSKSKELYSTVIYAIRDIMAEFDSIPAKMNIGADIILGFVMVVFILYTTVEQIAQLIARAVLIGMGRDLSQFQNDHTFIYLLASFLFLSLTCMVFCGLVRVKVLKDDATKSNQLGP